MATERKHRCGGTLVPRDVTILDEKDVMSLGYVVPGLVCDRCREELIERETAITLQASQTPTISWRVSDTGSTMLDAATFKQFPAVASTKGVTA